MMERVDQERPGWGGDQFEVLTEEEVVGVGGEVAGMVTEDGMEKVGPVGVGREKAGLLLDGAGAGAGGEEGGEEGHDEGVGGGDVWAGEEGLGEEGRWEGNSEEAGHGEGGGDDGGDQGEDDGGDQGEDEGVALLRRLVRDFNVKTLAEKTGVAEGVLVELLAIERDRPDGALGVIGGCLWTGRCCGAGVLYHPW